MILEPPAGPYPVGATTFILPVRPAKVIGTAGVRTESGEIAPALRLEEVSFTAYYPASHSTTGERSRWLDWLPRYALPLAESVRGYSRFTGISQFLLWPLFFLFGSCIQVPALLKVSPLRTNRSPSMDPVPESMGQSMSQAPWPLIIFSHGLGGGATTYSKLCTHLASSGKVVLAMEHRDGTSPISRPRSERTGELSSQLYIPSDQVVWSGSENLNGFQDRRLAFRAEQIEFRKREIYLAYSAFRKLVMTGERGDLQTMDELSLDWEPWTGGWVRCHEGVTLMGHSFGGATVFALLTELSPKADDVSHIPVSRNIILDPWLEPLASPGPVPIIDPRLKSKHHKTLVINSESFTLWQDHFRRLKEVVPAWPESTLVTVVGAKHMSFSDIPFLTPIPIRDRAARPIINVIKTLALSFLDDTLPEVIRDLHKRKLEIKSDRSWFLAKKPKRRLVGQPGDAVIHRWGFDADIDNQGATETK
ncbi:platelet-activating factor acetylhydrolase, isoform II-domain-containing protein [Russula earlei]|uniref:Platelet-activating factor acetylhydrolase, isoform II-domain-containing protein n=1 Tax=Russula earlei TaxID=71964 RepID=A0ACC0U9H9_9AGAM|nr:platelet-activating factor acetylhydrolase, isoform II-domain-containing protein [Russula earlei]